MRQLRDPLMRRRSVARRLLMSSEVTGDLIDSAHLNESNLVRAVESIDDVVEITDAQGRFKYVNPSFTTLLGYDRDSLIGLDADDLVLVEDPADRSDRRRRLAAGFVWSGVSRMKTKAGVVLEMESTTSGMYDADGALAGFVTVRRDCKVCHQVQRSGINSPATLGAGLASGVAHHINNPHGYDTANHEHIRDSFASSNTPPDGDLSEAITDALEGARRIRDVIRQLAAYGFPARERPQALDVRAVLDLVQAEMSELHPEIRFTTRIEPMLTIWAAESAFTMMVRHLLSNAAEAVQSTDGPKEIDVHARQVDDRVELHVTDTGPGMPTNLIQRAFEPFFTRGRTPNHLGLGLSACAAVVDQLGGTIRLEPRADSAGLIASVAVPRPRRAHSTSVRT